MEKKELEKLIDHFRSVQAGNQDMYNRTMREFRNMARGGDGGPSGMPGNKSLREQFYRGYSDLIFQTILEELGEDEAAGAPGLKPPANAGLKLCEDLPSLASN